MDNLILFDDESRDHLLPLTFTRPVCELRVGVLTIAEKWKRWFKTDQLSYITQDYLTQKYPIRIEDTNYVINASVLPNAQIFKLISQLDFDEALLTDGELVATKLSASQFERLMEDEEIEELRGFDLEDTPLQRIRRLWDIYRLNPEAIRSDFELLTSGRSSADLDGSNRLIGNPDQLFIEPGAKVQASILNAETGPIYIGKDAQIMEGSIIRGPFAMCENSVVKIGARITGGTTLGPYCKGGGEINNVVMTAYSNKGHEGYLGNSVLGEWCNIGAGTNASNLKNTYEEVKVWDYPEEGFRKSGQQFCGLFMADHSKCGIGTMFNTGTVIGVSANVFGAGYQRNFIPSFTWGGTGGMSTYQPGKVMSTIDRVMARRKLEVNQVEAAILEHIFEMTQSHRSWERKTAMSDS